LNTVNPGPDALFDNGVVTGPGQSFPSALFLSFPVANTASDDAVGSQGVFSRAFLGISPDLADPVDACAPLGPADPAQATLFNHAPEQRLITHRNTPTMIGAVFNFDSFWDGRASHDFNGLNPLGRAGGNPILGPTVLVGSNSSLASQAVGPPLSNVEMSCANRAFNGPNSLGAKLVLRTPLASQPVDPADSMLGPLSNAPASGLQCGFPDRLCTYADLIAAAFGTGGLSGQAAVDSFVNNFASIWGQAVQAYEATLIPDRTPYDLGTLTPNQQAGLNAFRGQPATGCTTCHVEPEFTDATVRLIRVDPATGVPPPKLAGGDQGFHDVGAAPSAADHGRRDSLGGVYNPSPRNDGAFKTAALRNVKLTAPYFHNGKLATLDEVVRFYNNSPNGVQVRANAGFDPDAAVNIAGGSIAAVVDFLQNGLTDCRVEHELAPFDHPAIAVPGGPTLPARGAAGDGTVCP
jgi:cytochrome c peroxidase